MPDLIDSIIRVKKRIPFQSPENQLRGKYPMPNDVLPEFGDAESTAKNMTDLND